MNVGKQSFQRGQLRDAVSAFGQATKLQPGRVEGWVNLGSALLENQRFADAVSALDRAIALNPKLTVAHMLLGDTLRQLGEFPLALQSYRAACALQRTPLTLNKLACALRVRQQLEDSRKLYLEAIQLDPKFTLAQVNLATLHIELRQFAEAQTQLNALAARSLPRTERAEIISSQRALSEYFRLAEPLATLGTRDATAALLDALTHTPDTALDVDETALKTIRRYVESAAQLYDNASAITGSPPPQWPLVEALFMIPLVNSVTEFLALRTQLDNGQQATGDVLESVNMEAAIVAARINADDLLDPVTAELQLRRWHALCCRGLEGFLPGHFKYTQNWTTRSPTLKRVDPAMTSGTFRYFIRELYSALPPGLPRAAVVWMAVSDMHLFADGNGRVATTWLNRELEWAGLMPALCPRELGLNGEMGKAMREVRTNGGDLTPLLDVISRAQVFAHDFCRELLA